MTEKIMKKKTLALTIIYGTVTFISVGYIALCIFIPQLILLAVAGGCVLLIGWGLNILKECEESE